MPLIMASSPRGLKQSIGGAIIFVFCIALYKASASSLAIVFGLALEFIFAFSHISLLTAWLTRQKSLCKNADTELDFVPCNILIRTPSSIPYGCGFISLASFGISLIPRMYVMVSLSGVL